MRKNTARMAAAKCSRLLGQCEHLFHCPKCGRGSAHPDDAANSYCAVCGFTGDAPGPGLAARVYVAGPYSADPEACTAEAIRVGTELLDRGYAPFVPHLVHYWETLHASRPYEDWMRLDLAWVRAADVLLRLPGDSPGADREVAHAHAHGIPVVYSLDELPAAPDDVPACRVCGCTDERACPGGCSWVPDPTGQGDLCSRCESAAAPVEGGTP